MTPQVASSVIDAGGQAVGGLFSFIGAKKRAKKQHEYNLELAKFQADANEAYLDKQLAYDSPSAQMQRYREAGLNPNLVYTQGSAGNQGSPLSYPDIPSVPQPNSYESVKMGLEAYNRMSLIQSQVQATNANTVKIQNQAALSELQARVLARNPMLNDTAYNAIIDGLKAAAESKAAAADIDVAKAKWFNRRVVKSDADKGIYYNMTNGNRKMELELESLEQRFHLSTQDEKIKQEIWKSKEFQNAILEVQKRFMTDMEITPQHIVDFIRLLIQKSNF